MALLSSISEHMDSEVISAEMRMERQVFSGSFILFEGSKDARRFERFLHSDECSVVICWGKQKLLDVFRLIEPSPLNGYVALVDSDFDQLLDTKIQSPNLIYSETHDFDLDSVLTSIFDRYLSEVADTAKCENIGSAHDVRLYIADCIKNLSLIKFTNFTQPKQYPLSSLNWSSCFNGEQFNTDKFVHSILKKEYPERLEVDRFKERSLRDEGHDIWQLTNGHDFFIAFGICLTNFLGNRKKQQAEGNEVERHIRFGLNECDFEAMLVYSQIEEWTLNSGYSVLSDRFNRH